MNTAKKSSILEKYQILMIMDRIQTRPTFKKPDLESTKTSGSGFATPIGKMSGQYNIVIFKQETS